MVTQVEKQHNGCPHDNASHSRMVATWSQSIKVACNPFDAVEWAKGESYTLNSPVADCYRVSVTFTPYIGRELVRISGVNWRCEDEPHGVYHVKDARAFYAKLLRSGFIIEK